MTVSELRKTYLGTGTVNKIKIHFRGTGKEIQKRGIVEKLFYGTVH